MVDEMSSHIQECIRNEWERALRPPPVLASDRASVRRTGHADDHVRRDDGLGSEVHLEVRAQRVMPRLCGASMITIFHAPEYSCVAAVCGKAESTMSMQCG